MRTAESVTFTCCPPAPDERYVSMRKSLASISGASVASSAGTTSNDANAVCRRALASNGEMRISRWTPRSLVSNPYAYRPFTVKVAELSPASVPGETSSSSTPNPRRSAQRRYIRRSMFVQSCASVPPAPEFTVQIASRSSCSPVNSARSSSSSRRAVRLRIASSISRSSESSPSSCASSTRVSTSDSCVSRSSTNTMSSLSCACSVLTLRAMS